jgi:hypothetical protein
MNSVKVSVSGKNATCSVFIPCSQIQKEEAEKIEYEIKNSLTSSEEDDDDTSTYYSGDGDICDICDEIMPNNCNCKCNKCNDFLNDGCKCNEEEAEIEAYVYRNCDCTKKECVCGGDDDSDDETMHDSEEEEEECGCDDDSDDYNSDEEELEEKSSYIVGQKQKPRVERKSWYRVKKEEEEESDFENEHDEIKHLEEVEVLKNESDNKIKKLEDELDYIKAVLKMLLVSNRSDYDEDFDYTSKILLQRVERCIRDKCELQEEIETLQLSVTNHEKKYEGLQNLYCEEKQKRIDLEKQSKIDESELIWYKNKCKSLSDENFKEKEMRVEANKYDTKIYNKLEKELKEVKKQLKEVSEEADMAVHNHSVDAKALFKEIALNNKLREKIEELKEELREERIFRRDNEDNFFRLLDEHRRLEKVMKNVSL